MNKIEAILEKEGFFACTTSGVSMFPMLRNRRDTVIIHPVSEHLKKYDVLLYRRGDDYVLHRVVKVLEDGYLIRGDNCLNNEFVLDNQIIGILVSFYRGERLVKIDDIRYVSYYKFWCFIYPLRAVLMKLRFKIGQIVRRIRKNK